MRKWNILFSSVIMVVIAVVIQGCGDDDEVGIRNPTVSLSGEDYDQTVFVPGETIDLTVSFTAPQGLKQIDYYLLNDENNELGGETIDPEDIGFSSEDTEGTFEAGFFVPQNIEGESVTLVIEVVDISSTATAEADFPFSIGRAVSEYDEVVLGHFKHTTTGSFYNATDNKIYSANDAINKNDSVDFVFYIVEGTDSEVNTDDNYILASPDNAIAQTTWEAQSEEDWPLAAENITRFKPLGSSFEFDAEMTSDEIADAYPENGDAMDRIDNLEEGQMYAFVLDDERGARYGILRIENIGGNLETDRTITLSLKVESQDNN